MRETLSTPQTEAPPEIMYRIEVEDPKTEQRYFVLIGEDGMAFREVAAEPLLKVG